MRRSIIVFSAALAATIVVAGSIVWADTRPINYVSSKWLQQACGKNGGYYGQVNEHFSCIKECQSESGNHAVCRVDCDSKTKSCEGQTPDRAVGGTVQQILRATAYKGQSNVKTTTNNPGNAAQPSAGTRMINNPGTFQAQPRAAGVPTTATPSLAIPARTAPSQGTVNMQKR